MNEAEQAILAVESLEREVNNGGHHQYRAYDVTGESIADRLFAYIAAHRGLVRLS